MQIKLFLGIIFLAILSSVQASAQSSNVHNLLDSCKSKDKIVVFTAVKSLQKINKQAFDSKAILILENLLLEEPVQLNELIKIAGFVGMEEFLLNFTTYKKWDKSTIKAINLALVRSGNERKIKSLVRGASKIPTDDSFAYYVVPTLVYARQKAVIDNLLDRIMEVGENCKPSDVETVGEISCAFPIIEQIAPYIVGFPVETDKYGILVEDYDRMLKMVRKWIKENKDNYRIDFEKY